MRLLSIPSIVITLSSCLISVTARSCQIRNYAGESVNFYWMDTTKPGNYIKQTKSSLQQASSAPLKTYEGHRFFAAWADEADQVMTWDPDTIPATLQFVHRGFDQVVTAKVDDQGALYLDDWDIHEGEMARLTKAIANCTSDDTSLYAQCIEEVGAAAVGRLETEKEMIRTQNTRMRQRLANSFCGKAQYQSKPVRSLTWGDDDMEVDVLANTPDVTIYHLKDFLKPYAGAVMANKGEKDQRLKEVWPQESSSVDMSLVELNKQVERFVQDQLPDVELNTEKPGEPLRLFQYGESQIHAPPCDGNCPLMAKQPSEYVATLMAYAKVPANGGAWRFTMADKSEVTLVPKINDAVIFIYKTKGYIPEILPHLTACPLGEGDHQEMLVVSRWVDGKVGVPTSPSSDEL